MMGWGDNWLLRVSVKSLAAVVLGLTTNVSVQASSSPPESFKKCIACHQVGDGAKNKIGPHLNTLEDRPVASAKGYKYSKAFRKFADEKGVWTVETLDAFLKKPRKYIRGTKMSFGGLKDDDQRIALVNWLLHTDKKKANLSGDQLLGASAAALKGDAEYGEYLAGECVTCHRPGGADGIPTISGWEPPNFIHALYEYKQEVRKNPVMITVSKRLGDEEMAALAAYFSSIKGE